LVRLDTESGEFALLHYPGLFDDPFPALAASLRVDLHDGSVSRRTYTESLNPPILHRKELLLPEEDPRRETFAALSAACESVGLFDEPRRIGYRRQWEQLVRERGYRVVDHQLVPIGNDEGDESSPDAETDSGAAMLGWEAARHRTALSLRIFGARPVSSEAWILGRAFSVVRLWLRSWR
jgi:hypothetical protein